jgi:hypothetical protein
MARSDDWSFTALDLRQAVREPIARPELLCREAGTVVSSTAKVATSRLGLAVTDPGR